MPGPFNLQQYLPTLFDFQLIYPQIIILAFIIGIILHSLFFDSTDTRGAAFLAAGGLIVAGCYTGYFFLQGTGPNPWAFTDMLLVDSYSLFFSLIFIISGVLTVFASVRYIEREDMNQAEYYVVILGAVLGMMIMASAASLITIFLGIETLSISLYILAGFNRNKPTSGEAAIKYLLLGGFATGFLLYGIALIYGATGALDISSISTFIHAGGIKNTMIVTGMVLMLVGFMFKASLAPFHMWAPDVYQGAPTPITGFMSTAAKAAAFAVLFRVLMIAMPDLHKHWHNLLYVVAILTMTIGNVTAVTQTNIKRLLAYSSIAHAGYLVIAILAGGLKVPEGNYSIAYYLLAYTLMNMGAFTVLAMLSRKNQPNETLSAFAGIGYKHPVLAAAMALFMLSLAGIPPTAGFFGKFYIFSSAIKAAGANPGSGMLALVIIGVLNAVVSVYYYLRVIVVMYMHEPEIEIQQEAPSFIAGLGVAIAAAGIAAMGLFPSYFINIVQHAIFARLWQ